MGNLSNEEKQEIVNTKLLNIDQLVEYAKKVLDIMDGYNIRFPVLAIVERDEGFSHPHHYYQYRRRAEWRRLECHFPANPDSPPIIDIGDRYANEWVIGYLTMDTPWEDIKQILNNLDVDPGWTD